MKGAWASRDFQHIVCEDARMCLTTCLSKMAESGDTPSLHLAVTWLYHLASALQVWISTCKVKLPISVADLLQISIIDYNTGWQISHELNYVQQKLFVLQPLKSACNAVVLVDYYKLSVLLFLQYSFQYMHIRDSESAILHRNVQPDNIFITCIGVLKLAAFASARRVSSLSGPGTGGYGGGPRGHAPLTVMVGAEGIFLSPERQHGQPYNEAVS